MSDEQDVWDRLLSLFDVGIGLLLVTSCSTVAYASFQAVYAEPWYMKRRQLERIIAGRANAQERAATGLVGSGSAPGLSPPPGTNPSNPPIPPPSPEDDDRPLQVASSVTIEKDPVVPSPPSSPSKTLNSSEKKMKNSSDTKTEPSHESSSPPSSSGHVSNNNDQNKTSSQQNNSGEENAHNSPGVSGAAGVGSSSSGTEGNGSGEAQEIYLGKTWALLFPVMASIMLMLMFFVPSVMVAILSVTFSLTGAHGIVVSIRPLMWWVIKNVHNRGWMNVPAVVNVKGIGLTPMSYVLGWPIGLGVVIAYWSTRAWAGNWILNNLIGMGVTIYLVSSLRFANVKVLTIALVGLFIYDIFWVFLSESIFEENVMLTVATSISLPIVLIFPRFTTTGVIGGFALIGLGDLALPGLLLAYALKVDYFQHWDTRYKKGYWSVLMTGYILGLLVTFVGGAIMAAGQPALLYLVPMTLGPFLYMSRKSGDWDKVWKREKFSETNAQARVQIEARLSALAAATAAAGGPSSA